MNNRFYIKQITAIGENKAPATIEFEDGINIIKGPSNSGKSYVINCINFMLAGKIPFESRSTGYNKVTMKLQSTNGESISMSRSIIVKNNKEIESTFVKVESSINEIENKEYKIKGEEYSDLLLHLMGIKETHSIIKTQSYKTQKLTIRSIIHFLFISETNIFKETTALFSTAYPAPTKNITSLKFLFSGDDMMNLIPEETEVERRLKKEKNKALSAYINDKIIKLKQRKKILENILAEHKNINIDEEINNIFENISNIENEIIQATEQSKQYLKEIYYYNSKLEEAEYLKERYNSLQTQYIADCNRLEFIIEGSENKTKIKPPQKCPFCASKLKENSHNEYEYIKLSRIELNKIKNQIDELNKTTDDLNIQIKEINNKIENINIKHENIKKIINKQLNPKASELKINLNNYNKIVSYQQEIESIEKLIDYSYQDLSTFDNSSDNKIQNFNAKDTLTTEEWDKLNGLYESAVINCGYPNVSIVTLSKESMDGIINNKHKKNEGKGYRAFLNTICLFIIMKYLENYGFYKPSLLILDSPILSLKENIEDSEHATSSMKSLLFKYIIEQCGNNQIIIAENDIPEDIDYSNINLISFTKENNKGRYGFLYQQN